eukprot:SRR837773.28173.p3 GENE.SRR837773.28173~~SRR837773.28173.p3  ORF type:complete len:152 (-),score=64.22 SRR837773.28173:9-464(-)
MPSSKFNNPFIRYRQRLFAYHLARSLGLKDSDWVDMATELDKGIARVEPKGPGGFRQTPLKFYEDLKVWGKDESNQVGQSHKARHFGNVMLYLQTLLRAKAPASKGLRERPLAVASCGNAALAAATVAAAMDWPIQVFIPDDAEARRWSRV